MRVATLLVSGLLLATAACTAAPATAPTPTPSSASSSVASSPPTAPPLELTTVPAFAPGDAASVQCAGEGVSVYTTQSGGRVSPMVVAGPATASAALVFAHQSDGDECQWLGQARRFAEQGYRVYLPRAAGKDAPSLLAAAVSAARSAGATKVGLVGASMGGTNAVATASAVQPGPDAVVAISAPAEFGGVDAAGLIGRVQAPILLEVAAQDNDFASALTKLAAAAPSAQTVVQPGTSAHGVRLIAAGGPAAEALSTFLAQHVPVS